MVVCPTTDDHGGGKGKFIGRDVTLSTTRAVKEAHRPWEHTPRDEVGKRFTCCGGADDRPPHVCRAEKVQADYD